MEFKQDAARFILEKGYIHQKAADNPGILLYAIDRWVRAERGSTTDGETKEVVLKLADQAELVHLRRENEQLRMEREIIKKTAASKLRKSSEIRVYSRATEDLSSDRIMMMTSLCVSVLQMADVVK